jgi:hypothetical protein
MPSSSFVVTIKEALMNSNLLGKTRSYKFFNFEYTWTEIISIKGVKISQSHVKKNRSHHSWACSAFIFFH